MILTSQEPGSDGVESSSKLISKDIEYAAKHPSDVIGNWGPIQRRIFIMVTIVYLCGPLNNSSIVFYQPQYDFYCNFLNETTGSYEKLLNACEYPDVKAGAAKTCTNFTYDDTIFKRTIVSEFDLVCAQSYFGSVSQSFHQFGYMVSGIFLGYVSDRRGRKYAAILSIVMEIFAGFGQALSPNIYAFWFSRFFVGVSAYGRYMSCYVLFSEWVGPESRAKGMAMHEILGWHAGNILLPFLFRVANTDFQIMQSGVSVFEIMVFIPFMFLVWESPRWLLTHGKFDEAEKRLTIAASARNKLTRAEIKQRIRSIRDHTENEVISEDAANQSVFDAWKDPNIRRLSMILYFSWFTMSFVYYAFNLNIQNLGGDLFSNFIILSLVDAVVHGIFYFFIDLFARKTLLDASLMIQTISLLCILITSFNDDYLIYRIIASCLLKVGLSMSIIIHYLYTAESFPTSMRQASIGTCSTFSRIGSISAPFVKELTNATHLYVPTILFMMFTITNLILIQFIPETGKIQMPDTIGQRKNQIASPKSSDEISENNC